MSYAKNIAPDNELRLRMAFTYLCLIGIWLIGFLLLLLTGAGIILAAVIEFIILFLQYWYSDRIAMFGIGATEVSRSDAPELHLMVDRLCELAAMPKPRLAIADTDMPNAFAAGRNSRHSVIIVTRGLQDRIDDDELYAVLSHEIAHIAHRDVAVMAIASSVVILAGLLTQASIWNSMSSSRRGRNDSRGASIVTSIALYVVSLLLIRAVSRYRELLADRTGAILISDPRSLASALTKITGEIGSIPRKDLRSAESFNAFFFAPALGHRKGQSFSNLFATHPPLHKRLEQLEQIELMLNS